MKILERLRLGGGSPSPIYKYPDPKLAQELKETKNQLSSILTKWNWGGKHPKSAPEFLNRFEPWINEKIQEQKQLSEFLKDNSCKDLGEVVKMIVSYEEKIEELRKSKGGLTEEDQKKLKEYDDLEAEKDEVIRDKNSLEQDLIATNNRLKLKQQETTNKENEITRIKKEFSEKDKALNKKIQEAKSDLTDYKKQYGELKTKYSKQGQLLDEEQTDNNKLNKKIEQLENKIKELTK